MRSSVATTATDDEQVKLPLILAGHISEAGLDRLAELEPLDGGDDLLRHELAEND